jgi:hypothetical protein
MDSYSLGNNIIIYPPFPILFSLENVILYFALIPALFGNTSKFFIHTFPTLYYSPNSN